MKKRFLLVGNYGVGNVGDEALKQYFLQIFSEHEWQVISATPVATELSRFPAGVRSLLAGDWKRTRQALQQADGLVFGGGSLFTDSESWRACFLWWVHAWWAYQLDKPIYLAFQGIGPLNSRLATWFTRWVLQRAAFISVRDSYSKNRVDTLLKNKKCVQSFDPVISLIKNKKLDNRTKNVLIIIPRKNSGDNFVQLAQKINNQQDWHEVRVLSLQSADSAERAVCRELVSALGEKATAHPVTHLSELVNHCQEADQVVSHRFHGSLVAKALGCKVTIQTQGKNDKHASLYTLDVEQSQKMVKDGEAALRATLGKVFSNLRMTLK